MTEKGLSLDFVSIEVIKMDKIYKVTTFKERFGELFDESEKTTLELSKELHVSNQTISAWKLGTRSPKEPTVIAIANYFHVSVEWLLGFNVPKDYQPYGAEPPDDQPKTTEARILAKGIDNMPPEQREAIMSMMMGLYPGVFEKGTKEDET